MPVSGRDGLVREVSPVSNRRLLQVGIVGTVIAALCCFTPLLVVLLGVVGLSFVTGYLDIVLIPAFLAFVGLIVYALWGRQRGIPPVTRGE